MRVLLSLFFLCTYLSANLPVDRLAAGMEHNLYIHSDSTIWVWGSNTNNQLALPGSSLQMSPRQLTGGKWTSVSAKNDNSYAIRNDSTLWVWGPNDRGQLSLPDSSNVSVLTPILFSQKWKKVSAGDKYALAITVDSSLWVWGANGSGQLGTGNTSDVTTGTAIETDKKWLDASAGKAFSLGLAADSTLWVWGSNEHGQLGKGDSASQLTPVQVEPAKKWRAIVAGDSSSFLIAADSTLWVAGANNFGELGDSTLVDASTFTQVGADKWLQIDSYNDLTLGLKSDGTLWASGNNLVVDRLALGNQSLNNFTQIISDSLVSIQNIELGKTHSLFLRNDETIWVTGKGEKGVLGLGYEDVNDELDSAVQVIQITLVGHVNDMVLNENFGTIALSLQGMVESWGSIHHTVELKQGLVEATVRNDSLFLESKTEVSGVDTVTINFLGVNTGTFVSETFILTINPQNDPPRLKVRMADYDGVKEDFIGALELNLNEIFEDQDSELQYTARSTDSVVRVTLMDSIVEITSLQDRSGVDQIIISASDKFSSVYDTIMITVSETNDFPKVIQEIDSLEVIEDFIEEYRYPLMDYIIDVDSDLEYRVDSQVDRVLVRLENDTLIVSANANHSGRDIIDIYAEDEEKTAVLQIWVIIEAVNDVPVLVRSLESYFVQEDFTDTLEISLDYLFDDVDGNDTLRYFYEHLDTLTNLRVMDGIAYVVSQPDKNGTSRFVVGVSDGKEKTTDTLLIHVEPVNDAPKLIQTFGNIWSDEDFAIPFDYELESFFIDIDSDTISYSFSMSDSLVDPHVENDVLLIESRTNLFGVDTVVVIASDGELIATDTFVVHLEAVNDDPVIDSSIVHDILNDSITFPLDLSDLKITDPDGDSVSIGIDGEDKDLFELVNDSLILRDGVDSSALSDTLNLILVLHDGTDSTYHEFEVVLFGRDDINPVLELDDSQFRVDFQGGEYPGQDGEVLLYNLAGELIDRVPLFSENNTFKWNRHLNEGMYLLMIHLESGQRMYSVMTIHNP